MTHRRAVALYLGLVVALAAVGGVSQRLLDEQRQLIEAKTTALDAVAELRAEANRIVGPAAVRAWAEAQGMVPAPEVPRTATVPHDPLGTTPLPHPTLEVRTRWR